MTYECLCAFVCVCVCVCVCVFRSGQAAMAAIYYEKIDVEGHHFGPDSNQVRTAVRQLDLAMQMLNKKIKVSYMILFIYIYITFVNIITAAAFLVMYFCCMLWLPLQEKNMVNQLNIMLFSDHGMTKIQWMEKVIELDQYINMSDIVKMMDRGPVVSLWPKDNKYQTVRP